MRLAAAALVLFSCLVACGTDVDLGGTGSTNDGSSPTVCGALVAPTVDAGCKACSPSSDDCQPNGCYGGYWCNTMTIDCAQAPKTCP